MKQPEIPSYDDSTLRAAAAQAASLERRLIDCEHRREVSERALHAEKSRNRGLHKELERLRKDLSATKKLLEAMRGAVDALYKSRRWRAATLFRSGTRSGFKPIDVLLNKFAQWKPRSGKVPAQLLSEPNRYTSWLDAQRAGMAATRGTEAPRDPSPGPCFCLVMHVSATAGAGEIQRSAQSVIAQTWPDWRLLIVGASKGADAVAVEDHRIMRAALPESIPAEATHAAALGVGDLLEPDALTQVARLMARQSDPLDLIYTDEGEVSPKGAFSNPLFKPAWSPETLESFDCVGALAVYRRELLDGLGAGVDSLHPKAAYGLVLRAGERPRLLAERLPRLLYHRQQMDETSRESARRADLEALQASLMRRGEIADASISPHGVFHVRRAIFKHERVSILIPTRDRLELLRRCIETLTARTAYQNYEIVILNNESSEPWTLEWLANCGHRVLDCPGPFNYAAMHNAAVRAVDSPWLCLLNNDTEIIEPHWLGAMCEHVQRPEIGCVGAKLLFPDGLVQHAGVVLGIQGRAAHAFAGKQAHHPGARGQLHAVRNYSAVTAACMMIRREVFLGIGGFDEQRFPVAYNDVELCVRALRHGYRNVYTPHAVLKHHECATRPRVDNPHEVAGLRETCLGPNGWTDPFYHPSLSHDDANFMLAHE